MIGLNRVKGGQSSVLSGKWDGLLTAPCSEQASNINKAVISNVPYLPHQHGVQSALSDQLAFPATSSFSGNKNNHRLNET